MSPAVRAAAQDVAWHARRLQEAQEAEARAQAVIAEEKAALAAAVDRLCALECADRGVSGEVTA